jgi:hypothetical protein
MPSADEVERSADAAAALSVPPRDGAAAHAIEEVVDRDLAGSGGKGTALIEQIGHQRVVQPYGQALDPSGDGAGGTPEQLCDAASRQLLHQDHLDQRAIAWLQIGEPLADRTGQTMLKGFEIVRLEQIEAIHAVSFQCLSITKHVGRIAYVRVLSRKKFQTCSSVPALYFNR